MFNTRGTVTSPGYPGNVSRPTDCRWELAVPIGMLVKIDFPGNKDNENLLINASSIQFFVSFFFSSITNSIFVFFLVFSETSVFQFGPADDCTNNYVELSDIQQNAGGAIGEAWRARYCGNVSH